MDKQTNHEMQPMRYYENTDVHIAYCSYVTGIHSWEGVYITVM